MVKFGQLARNDQKFLYIYQVNNETEIKRFQQKVVVEGLERLFEIIEMVVNMTASELRLILPTF